MKATLQIRVVRFRIHKARRRQAPRLFGSEFQPDLVGNGAGELVLQPEHVAQITLVPVRPQLFSGLWTNQLRRDAHPVA